MIYADLFIFNFLGREKELNYLEFGNIGIHPNKANIQQADAEPALRLQRVIQATEYARLN